MDRRTVLALLLTAGVIIVTPILFPAPRRPAPVVDSTALAPDSAARRSESESETQTRAQTRQPVASQTQTRTQTQTQTPTAAREDTTTVTTQHAVYRISSMGATPVE